MSNSRGARRRTLKTGKQTSEELSIYQGPLPQPEDLAKYNEIITNGADRLMSLVEDERRDRNRHISEENKLKEVQIKGNILNERFLLIISFLIILLFLGLCGFGFYLGYPTQSATILTVSLVAIIGYVTKQKSSKDK